MLTLPNASESKSTGAARSGEPPARGGLTSQLFFSSLRVQFLICLFAGVIVPVLVYFRNDLSAVTEDPAAWNSALAASFAIFAGVVGVRKLADFPGTIAASYVFPAFAASYGVAMFTILLIRAPYSGVLLSISLALSLIVRFAISAMERKGGRGVYCLVPGGNISRITRDMETASIMLEEPALPNIPDAIIVADLHYDHTDEWERTFAIAALNGIGVHHYKQVWEAKTGKVRIEHLSENSFGSLIPSNSYAKVKRLFDIVLTAIALPILILPLLVVAFLIRMDSPGSVFFRQERIGYRGNSFRVLKFRTMYEAREPGGDGTNSIHDAITRDGDDRITRIGRFLRKTRIDELPQILNILRGEMSWIGPRPEARPLSEWYEREIPFYCYRHIVRPGITGWAQVNQGHVAAISEVHDKLRFDFYYIKNFSLWLDLVVLFKTVAVVTRGIGAK